MAANALLSSSVSVGLAAACSRALRQISALVAGLIPTAPTVGARPGSVQPDGHARGWRKARGVSWQDARCLRPGEGG